MALDSKTKRDATAGLYVLPAGFPGMVHVTDAAGLVVQVTDVWLKVLGYSRAEVQGQPASRFFTPDSRVRLQGAGLIPGQPLLQRLRMRKATDDTLEVIACSTRHGDGQMVFLTDFSAYRDMEDRLVKKQRDLQSYIDGANAGTWEWDIQAGEVHYNERVAEIVGYRLGDLSPMKIETWDRLIHPEDKAQADAELERHFRGETRHYDAALRLRHRDGHWVWVRDRGRVFTRTPDGAPKRMFGTLLDISEQMHNQTEQRKATRLLDRTGELAGVGGWELDLQDNSLSWTAEMKRIHAVPDTYSPSLPKSFGFFADGAQRTMAEAVMACIEHGVPYDLELPFNRANGERIWVRTVGQLEHRDGKPRRVNGALQDITQKVRQTDALMAANARVALAAGSGRVGTWTMDAESGHLIWDGLMVEHFSDMVTATPPTAEAWIAALPAAPAKVLRAALNRAQMTGDAIDLVLDLPCTGAERALKIVAAPHCGRDGRVETLQGVCLDVTPQRLMTRELEEQSSRMAVTLASIGDGVMTTDAANRLLWMNPEAERLTGWALSDAMGKPARAVFNVRDEATGAPALDVLAGCIALGAPVHTEADIDLCRRDGTLCAIEGSAAPILGDHGSTLGAVLVFRDVSERRRLVREVAHRASHDWLTGLVNRAEFETRLQAIQSDPEASDNTLLFIDLDHFKRVNDSLGHATGDTLLRDLAALMQSVAPRGALIGRLGGDEFGILLEGATARAAMAVADDLCAAISAHRVRLEGRETDIRIGASIGLVRLGPDHHSMAELMRQADIAAYTAKAKGRGQTVIWTPGDAAMQRMSRQVSVVAQLDAAIETGAFEIHAQPIEPVADNGAPSLSELLIRLRAPDGSLILPGDFVPAAERYGLATRLDLWMVGQALDLITGGSVSDTRLLSVNLSGASISSIGFQQRLLALLAGLSPEVTRRLCVEITETAVVNNLASASDLLAQLRQRQIKVALDDFGAGASSFRYLGDLPLDYLKIDGHFIANLDDPIRLASLRCFIQMADAAGLYSIAEHVETADQMATLSEMGVSHVQGWHIGRPAPVRPAATARP